LVIDVRIKKNNGEKSIDDVMTRLNAARASTGGSPVQRHGFALEVLVPVLESFIELHPSVPETDRRQVIRDGVLSAAAEAIFDRAVLKKHLERSEARYMQEPEQKFILATSWTAPPGSKTKRVCSGRATVSFSTSSRIHLDRAPIQARIEALTPRQALEMLQVRVHVTARTPSGAFEIGRHEVDYARGVWNFIINKGTSLSPFSMGPQQPINKILPGPIHTIHTSRGALATETVWYELHSPEQIPLISAAQIRIIEERAQMIHRRVMENAYRRDVQHAFVRYTRALDYVDHATAFIRLWTTIEYLANTSKFDELVRRILFLTGDAQQGFVETVLLHMRDVRNGLVHGDSPLKYTDMREGLEAYLFQLKVFAEWLLSFHLRSGRKHKTRASATEVLDTPTNKEELQRRIRLYRRVLTHRK
jgi:hypothetical protein